MSTTSSAVDYAPERRRVVGATQMCDRPIEVSNSGMNWHKLAGVPACRRCAESSRIYQIARRFRLGQSIRLNADDLAELVEAWETGPKKISAAVEAMLLGSARP